MVGVGLGTAEHSMSREGGIMLKTKHDRLAYDLVAQMLHWLTLLLLGLQFGLAWSAPERLASPDALISLHLSFGVVVLIVALVRLAWRVIRPAPALPADLPDWQRLGSHALQVLLYVLLIALPILGWLWAGERGWPVSLFGFAALPDLASRGSSFGRLAGDLHGLLSNVLLVLVGVHVLGALYHAVVRRDGVMQRMLPAPRRPT
ncbi:cytochrome b [Mycobacterium sp. KBS0706]|nr:cytochrome b [Mycobacterium sp. KBS0706]